MKSKHTPGPWEVTHDPKLAPINVSSKGGPVVASNLYVRDASLIAAAPDLLAALEALKHIATYYHKGEAPGHEDACENPDCCGHCLAMRKVDAAIAKATP